MSACHVSVMLERNDIGAYRLGKILKNYTDKSLRLIVVKALDFQHRSRVQNHWVAPKSTQPFILPRSIS